MADIHQLQATLNTFASMLAPSKRRALLRVLMLEVRRLNMRRIGTEQDPEGDAWTERKNTARKSGQKKLMAGLKNKIQIQATADTAQIGFTGRTGTIALIHHEGLVAAVAPGGPRIRYEMRQILGLADGDLQILENLIYQKLKV